MAADTPVAGVPQQEHQSELAVAVRHVAEARQIVVRQRERIARLQAQGSCTRDFERTLGLFIGTLQILEEHERALRRAVSVEPKPRRLS